VCPPIPQRVDDLLVLPGRILALFVRGGRGFTWEHSCACCEEKLWRQSYGASSLLIADPYPAFKIMRIRIHKPVVFLELNSF